MWFFSVRATLADGPSTTLSTVRHVLRERGALRVKLLVPVVIMAALPLQPEVRRVLSAPRATSPPFKGQPPVKSAGLQPSLATPEGVSARSVRVENFLQVGAAFRVKLVLEGTILLLDPPVVPAKHSKTSSCLTVLLPLVLRTPFVLEAGSCQFQTKDSGLTGAALSL